MATFTCQTDRWVSTSPYVKLTVVTTETNSTVKLSYTLQYISDYGAASSSAAKGFSVSIGGEVVKSGKYYIGGVTSGKICEGEITYNKTKATQTLACSCSFSFGLTWSGSFCNSKSASMNATISPLKKYTITYNANGGTGAPSAQTKWYNEALTLSSTKPTKTGYTFKGWCESATLTTVDYQPGASYTINASKTLYAIWQANIYEVVYDANGGTGAPSSQFKSYGQTLTLTTAKPTRTGYTFKGWATSSTGAVSYQAGGTFTENREIRLYAVWEVSYRLPKIYNVKVEWSSQHPSVRFDWETTNPNPNFEFVFYKANGDIAHSVALAITSGATHNNNGPEVMPNDDILLNSDESYTVKITGIDSGGSTTVTAILTGNIYPIDVLAGGKGISFGGPASLEDTAHFQWAARFDKPVHGMVRGLGKLPKIEAGSDFNDYMDFGVWAVYGNADSLSILNMPPLFSNSGTMVGRAGILEVYSPTGEGMRSAEWSYIRQRFIPYSLSYPIMERDITRNASNVWSYGSWYQTSLSAKDIPVTIYDGTTGSSGTITLSQAVSNFKFLEIFFVDNNNKKGGYTKVPTSGTSAFTVSLSIIEAAGTNTYIRRTSYSISGTAMTPDTTNAGFARLNGTAVTHTTGTNYIKITRVVGCNS